MQEYPTIAAIDLGSNSFRLQVARVVDDQIYPLDSLKETVRLAAGIAPDKTLDAAAQERALSCLRRFNERLRGLPPGAVRAVGTNTFRVIKQAKPFLKAAQAALGFSIDIIAGREEARLIYLGVSHSLPASKRRRLVVDIGGGSTECIIGEGYKPCEMESLYMGCVTFSQHFFPNGKISKSALQKTELAVRAEAQGIAAHFGHDQWEEAIGSSGTARALADILQQNGWSDGGITAAGLKQLRAYLLKAGDTKALKGLRGLPEERIPVLPGGFAIMAGLFDELGIEHMRIAEGALREGVLYDLLGRVHQHDLRDVTVTQFMRRYGVDVNQAARVEAIALDLFDQVADRIVRDPESARQQLCWAARLHEVGITIAHAGYHKHSAYILANADMPGFSRHDQSRLSTLVRAHRGGLAKFTREQDIEDEDWELIAILRLAVLFCRGRRDRQLGHIRYVRDNQRMLIALDAEWIANNPMSETLLEDEIKQWAAAGGELEIHVQAISTD